jgi:hypothetical protein
MNCQDIEFSTQKAIERMRRARRVFEPLVLKRIFAFALFMFGAKRRDVAQLVGMPEQSVKTSIRVILRDGFKAFLDRRKSESPSIPRVSPHKTKRIHVFRDGELIVIDFNSDSGKVIIPANNKIQVKTVLLSLQNSGLLSTQEVASALEISESHCRELARKLACNDVWEALIDKRQGQLQDYRVGPNQKAEIIQQFAARAIIGLSTASDVLTGLVNEKTKVHISSRTVRWHMKKLNLTSIKKTLPELVWALKKTPETSS